MRRRSFALLGAIMLAGVAVVIVLLSGSSSARHEGATPFAPDSIWNQPLAADAPLASDSAALTANLGAQVTHYGTWINTYSFSVPVYTVGASQPRVPVVLDKNGSGSVGQLHQVLAAGVPIPAGARPATGTDAEIVIYQPAHDTLWELWLARQVGGTWHAQWGGRMEHVSTNPGYFENPPDWGAAATSLALLGGLIRPQELRAGHIDHALAISIPAARKGVFAVPAQRTDGKSTAANAVPEGMRFRLDPRLNLSTLHLPPVTLVLARAAQRYGLIVRDQSGTVAFYGQPNTAGGPDPYYMKGGLFGGLSPAAITRAFPWSHLQAVQAPLRSS